MSALQWAKDRDGFVCRAKPPSDDVVVFTLRAKPKGDGRWVWEVFTGETATRIATGIVNSVGAAKTAAQNFATRSGKI